MSFIALFIARGGLLALALGLTLATPPALAESSPAWTDPPVRGSAGPQDASETKPAAVKPAAETKPAADKSEPRKATGSGEPAAPPAAVAATPVPKAATPQRTVARAFVPYRRVVARPQLTARGPVVRQQSYRARLAEGPRREARRRLAERRLVVQRAAPRYERFAARYRRDAGAGYLPVGRVDPYDGRFEPSLMPRRRLAGWGDLIDDERAQRIAQARSMGYRVMRLRTYEFPDGSRMRDLMPLEGPGDTD